MAETTTHREILTFIRRERVGVAIEGVWFHPSPDFNHRPGQFIEIVVPHANPDSRGVRREFTIASSPTEPELMLGVKFSQPGSTFKQALRSLQPGQAVEVTFVGGEFVLPENPSPPLLLIAGGIGVTPFRAMLKWLTDTKQRRDAVLLYAAQAADDFVFADVLDPAAEVGVVVTHLVTDPTAEWRGERGRLEPATVARLVPDLTRRHVYVSGPEPLVQSLCRSLPTVGVRADQIHRDEFPGYRSLG